MKTVIGALLIASICLTARAGHADVESARRALKADRMVRGVVYDGTAEVQWHVGVKADGPTAEALCEVLRKHGAVKPGTQVRTVDIARIIKTGSTFHDASLGRVDCTTRESFER